MLRAMQLHPNPPRLVTVALALALAVIGVALAWPVDPLVALLAPVTGPIAAAGIPMDQTTGTIALLASSGLLVAGSLLPGI